MTPTTTGSPTICDSNKKHFLKKNPPTNSAQTALLTSGTLTGGAGWWYPTTNVKTMKIKQAPLNIEK
jgi:hypothetical protein